MGHVRIDGSVHTIMWNGTGWYDSKDGKSGVPRIMTHCEKDVWVKDAEMTNDAVTCSACNRKTGRTGRDTSSR